MLKKVFLGLFLLSCLSGFSQEGFDKGDFYLALDFGLGATGLGDLDPVFDEVTWFQKFFNGGQSVVPGGTTPRVMFSGLYFINKRFAVKSGLLFNRHHYGEYTITNEIGNTSYKNNINHYLSIPVLLRTSLSPSTTWQPYITLGVYNSFLLKQTDFEYANDYANYDFAWVKGLGIQKKWENFIFSCEFSHAVALIGAIKNTTLRNTSFDVLFSVAYKL